MSVRGGQDQRPGGGGAWPPISSAGGTRGRGERRGGGCRGGRRLRCKCWMSPLVAIVS